MSQSEWPRSNDRLIAERVEGLTVDDQYLPPLYVVNRGPDVPFEHRYEMVASYPKDLLACYRAAETWRKGGDGRMYILGSAVEMAEYTPSLPEVTMGDWCKGRWTTHGATLTEAFARALHELAERTPCVNDSK